MFVDSCAIVHGIETGPTVIATTHSPSIFSAPWWWHAGANNAKYSQSYRPKIELYLFLTQLKLMRFSEQFVLDVAFKEITLFLCVCTVHFIILTEHNSSSLLVSFRTLNQNYLVCVMRAAGHTSSCFSRFCLLFFSVVAYFLSAKSLHFVVEVFFVNEIFYRTFQTLDALSLFLSVNF